jgi:hypothetical protein
MFVKKWKAFFADPDAILASKLRILFREFVEVNEAVQNPGRCCPTLYGFIPYEIKRIYAEWPKVIDFQYYEDLNYGQLDRCIDLLYELRNAVFFLAGIIEPNVDEHVEIYFERITAKIPLIMQYSQGICAILRELETELRFSITGEIDWGEE